MNITFGLIIYQRIANKKIIRRVPYKHFLPQTGEERQKIVIWDTAKFKMQGQRSFVTDKDQGLDAYKAFAHVDYQLMVEGLYNPQFVDTSLTSIGQDLFYEQYEQYNKRGSK